jgi:hypothetical protein
MNDQLTAEKRGTPCSCPSNEAGKPICQEQTGNGIDSYCRAEQPIETIEQAFRRLYIARFVERGLRAEDGAASFDAVDFSDIDDMTPEQAADEELANWSDDGDE